MSLLKVIKGKSSVKPTIVVLPLPLTCNTTPSTIKFNMLKKHLQAIERFTFISFECRLYYPFYRFFLAPQFTPKGSGISK
jgi:hypothetical protein